MDCPIKRCIGDQRVKKVLRLVFSDSLFENFEKSLCGKIVVTRQPEMVNEGVNFKLRGRAFDCIEKLLPFDFRLIDRGALCFKKFRRVILD